MEKLFEKLKLCAALMDEGAKKDLYPYIWKAYYQKIYYYIHRICNIREHTEDIVQDIMMKVYNSLERYNITYSFNTWIFSIARNHCIDLLRKKNTIQESYEDEKKGVVKNSPEHSVLGHEIKTEIQKALETLKDTEREITFLHFYENMKYRDISRITGMPVGTIKYKMSVIKQKLKQVLQEYVQ